MGHAGEPSVEEILESIKKVIARDNRAEADQLRRRREQDGVVETRAIGPHDFAGDADFTADADPGAPPFEDGQLAPVLELTDAEMAPLSEDRDTFYDDADDADDDADMGRGDEPEAPLLAENARVSMRDSFAALAVLAEPGAQPQIVRSGETSLEALTRDLLRPMLAEWLDKHLPPMVEKLVAAEIARIAGKRG